MMFNTSNFDNCKQNLPVTLQVINLNDSNAFCYFRGVW